MKASYFNLSKILFILPPYPSYLRRTKAYAVLNRVQEAIDHRAEIAGVRGQVYNPHVEACQIFLRPPS
jgi:hypothetical protein